MGDQTLGVEKLLAAACYAAQQHTGQQRKDGSTPYINHPLQVARVLAEEGGVTDIPLLLAALLHDTVEDTGAEFDDLVERFGEEVAELVREVTDDKSLPKQRRKELQVETAPDKSPRAKQLKLADKISNLREIGPDTPSDWGVDRKRAYLDWAEEVIAGCRGVNQRLESLFDETLAAARQRLG